MNSREKKMLIALAIVVVLVVGYFGIYKPIVIQGQELSADIERLNGEIAQIEPDYLQMAEIEAEILSLDKANKKKLEKYPSSLSEEHSFRLLFDIEEEVGLNFTNIAFGERETVDAGAGSKEGEVCFSQSIVASTQTDYIGMKKVFELINEYPSKTALETVNVNEDKEDKLKLNIALQMIGVSSSENDYVPEFDAVELGKLSFFTKYDESKIIDHTNGEIADKPDDKDNENDDKDAKDAKNTAVKDDGKSDDIGDIFISMSSVDADAEAQNIGMMLVNPKSSVISYDENGSMMVYLTIYKDGNKHVASYSMGSYKRTEYFDMGKALELDVFSSKRVSAKDKAGIILSVNNKTTDTLYINVKNEDKASPRLKFKNMRGNYTIR